MLKVFDRFTNQQAFQLVGGLWVVYAALSMLAPRHSDVYHLSALQMALVQLTVIIPVLFIWLTAIYGAVKFKKYALLIRKSPDGQALNRLTYGLIILVFSFIVQGIIGIFPRYAVGSPLLWPLVFLHNHLPMVLAFIAIWFIYQGSSDLARLMHVEISTRQQWQVLAPFAALALAFAWFFYTHLEHVVVGGVPNFALPGIMPFFTLALPYVAIWVLGVVSILNVLNYTRTVKGALYKQALRYLATGIMGVLVFTIFLQFFTLFSALLAQLALGPILLLVYLLLFFYGIGFVLIALGAHKLARIEGV